MDDSFTTLNITVENNIARINLTRPELHNRFDEPLHEEFPRALSRIRSMPELRVLVLTAEGKSFSAGGDFDMILKGNTSKDFRRKLALEASEIFELMTSQRVPIVAAVQGAAIGLGATLLALSDVIVAWEGAKIADPHVKMGLVAGDGGVSGWAQSVGMARAKRYLLTGDIIPAKVAYEIGLVTDLVDSPEQAIPKAMEIAYKIAALPRDGVEGTKTAFNHLTRQYTGAVFELSLKNEMDAMASPDVVDVVNRALEKGK